MQQFAQTVGVLFPTRVVALAIAFVGLACALQAMTISIRAQSSAATPGPMNGGRLRLRIGRALWLRLSRSADAAWRIQGWGRMDGVAPPPLSTTLRARRFRSWIAAAETARAAYRAVRQAGPAAA